ncbi:MAG: ribbon-helix-helix protein, CopG family [Candidatus Hydrogenedens sp.]|nr:ribbon-helix-helix protein, CopG family [Candidatus Hydrogenedens sp.]
MPDPVRHILKVMKTTLSISEALVDAADLLARLNGKSRSEVIEAALRHYLKLHETDAVTEQLNRVYASEGDAPDAFASEASRRVLEQADW